MVRLFVLLVRLSLCLFVRLNMSVCATAGYITMQIDFPTLVSTRNVTLSVSEFRTSLEDARHARVILTTQ